MVVTVEISVSDPAELRALRNALSDFPGIEVTQVAGVPGEGEQGAWDFLQVAAASGGILVVAVKTLPEFIRSRRKDVALTVKLNRWGATEIVITAADADDAVKLIEKALDAGRD